MQLSRKQQLYLQILRWVLPHLRNAETLTGLRRLLAGSQYPEAELVHNLPRCLESPGFEEDDFWWCEVQAKNYCQQAEGRPCFLAVCDAVEAILDLMPGEMRERLSWPGPRP